MLQEKQTTVKDLIIFIKEISEHDHSSSAHYYGDYDRCNKCRADQLLKGMGLKIPYED